MKNLAPQGDEGNPSTSAFRCYHRGVDSRRFTRGGGVALLLAALIAPPSLALEPSRAMSQYHRRSWADQLPDPQVTCMVQTRDGFLWAGTLGGLVRLDGVRAEVFSSSTVSAFRNDYVVALLEDRTGTLWIGTVGGLVRRVGDQFDALTVAEGLSHDVVLTLAEDHEGGVWVGTKGGLDRIVDGRVAATPAVEALRGTAVVALAVDDAGTLWVASKRGIERLLGDRLVPANDLVESLVRTSDVLSIASGGKLWAIGGGRVVNLCSGRAVPLRTEGLPSLQSFLEDRDGQAWIGTPDRGVCRVEEGRAVCPPGALNPAASPEVEVLLEDREGSLWFGGAELIQLSDTAVEPLGAREGITGSPYGVDQGADGTLWVATTEGLLAVRQRDVERLVPPGDSPLVTVALVDDGGTVWAGGPAGLYRVSEGRLTAVPIPVFDDPPFVIALADDGANGLWVGTRGVGLVRLREGRVDQALAPGDGLTDGYIGAIAVAGEGVVWAGGTAGLNRISGGEVTTFTSRDGLAGDYVTALHLDPDGVVWVGTTGGLSRFDGKGLSSWRAADGLPSLHVAQILADDPGSLWVSSLKGVYRLERQDLDAVARGERRTLSPLLLGEEDGLPSIRCLGTVQPAGCRLADGRLCFTTTAGLALVDPRRPRLEVERAPVLLERVLVDGRAVPIGDTAVKVPPGRRSVEVAYTVPSFVRPDRLRFRTWLEGFDNDWVEVGERRTAYYTGLRPGRYRFRVSAGDLDRGWAPGEAGFELIVGARFFEAWWFQLAGLGVLGSVVWGGVQLRLRWLETRGRELEALVAQRTHQLAEANAELERLASEDPLTGLANRRRFFEHAALEWRRAVRAGSALSVVLLDLDHFKRFNDACGHPAGDRCLQAVGRVLTERIQRAGDLAGRYGGEEFIVLLTGTDRDGAVLVAEQLRDGVASERLPDPGPEGSHRVTISVGIATVTPRVGVTLEELIAAADQALYRSKEEGRNRVTAVFMGPG